MCYNRVVSCNLSLPLIADTLDSVTKSMDNDTQDYPVPDEHSLAFNVIKNTFRVKLLLVYHDRILVPPNNVTDVLHGALVEVHFALQHFHIFKEPAYNSFTGNIRQIVVHSVSNSKAKSEYVTQNIHDGPLLPSTLKRKNVEEEPSHHVPKSSKNIPPVRVS